MSKTVSMLVITALVLSGCGQVRDSRLNPFNWFGNSRSAPVDASGDVNALIPQRSSIFARRAEAEYAGDPIGQVTDLRVEPRPGGAILRVTGIADRAGPFDARLVEDEEQSTPDTLVYSLRALQSPGPRSVGPAARSVVVAIPLTFQDLRGIRTIRVVGERNQQITRR